MQVIRFVVYTKQFVAGARKDGIDDVIEIPRGRGLFAEKAAEIERNLGEDQGVVITIEEKDDAVLRITVWKEVHDEPSDSFVKQIADIYEFPDRDPRTIERAMEVVNKMDPGETAEFQVIHGDS